MRPANAPRAVIPRGKQIEKQSSQDPTYANMDKQPPSIRFAPRASFDLQQGVDAIANLARATLGPTPRTVAIASGWSGTRAPEILDDAATISRRIVEIPDAHANMGAMLIRQALWTVHEQVGDGSATTAVIMQALLREGIHLSAAGWNVMMIRRGIEKGLEVALQTLRGMARPVDTEKDVIGLVLAASGDPDLAARLGEMFDTLGADGHVEVQQGYTSGLSHEYIEGGFWKSGWISSLMATDELKSKAELTDPYVLVCRGRIETYEDITPILNTLAEQSGSALFIIALDVSGSALNVLIANKDKLPNAAVKGPSHGDEMDQLLEDIAALTGTRVVLNNLGESVRDVKLEDLGRARRVVVNKDYFGIVGGHGDPRQVRQRIADAARTALARRDQGRRGAAQTEGALGAPLERHWRYLRRGSYPLRGNRTP